MADASSADKQDHPSMVGGHVKYLQGAISSTFGYDSGETTKREAITEMRRASQSDPNSAAPSSPPAQSSILGTVEKKIGELTGCEGMEKEGSQRIGVGSEEASRTG